MGKLEEIKDEVKFMEKMSNRVLDIFAKRCAEAGKNGTATKPLTKEQLKRGWERKDWWLSSDECLKFGLVDEVR
jgi:ATP-dependent protease ClpP protease subunit